MDIRSLEEHELTGWCVRQGQPAYRGRQIYEWLWKKQVRNLDEMTNIPKDLRARLCEDFSLRPLREIQTSRSADGSEKVIYSLHGGAVLEGVLIPSKSDDQRVTACVSSQVGCSLRCAFCATARIPFGRNVTAGEIVDQVADLNAKSEAEHGRRLSNIVYMGMGEPLANYDEVVRSIRLITADNGLAFSPRRITLSTAGLVPEIRRLAGEKLGIHLAVSLHSAIERTRRSMMSSARTYDLDEIADAVRSWRKETGDIVTFEYLLLSGVNDTPEEHAALLRFARALPCKVNLIEYNSVVGIPFTGTSEGAINSFAQGLRDADVTVTVRHSRGKDIDAACGQLAARKIS